MPEYIYGHWPVMETLRANRRKFDQLLLSQKVEERGIVGDIVSLAKELDVPVKRVPARILNDLADGGNHQNTILRTGEYPYVDVEDMLDLAEERGEKPFLLMLDLLKDPQNVGSLIRVADAVGAHGVIMQERRSVSITPSVIRASSGAVEHIKIAQVTNLVSIMKELKKQDIWMIGLDIGPELLPVNKTDLNLAIGLILGSEGEGMRRLVRETCDLMLTLPMRGNVGSLNVATVGSVALYAAWQARNWQGWSSGSE